MSRSPRTLLTIALLIGTTLAVPGPAATAALPATNGPLLFGDRLINADGTDHPIKVPGTATMEFSPDGSRIAGVTLGNVVKIWSADGSSVNLATLPQTVRDVTWSSDGASVAALTGDPGNSPHSIYVVPLASGAPTLAYTDASDQRINLDDGISWQPGGTKILFTATMPFDPGDAFASKTQQLFTVPSTGGSSTQLWVPPSLSTSPQFRFGFPQWAPDGDRFAVWVQEDGVDVGGPYEDRYLSVMSAAAPTTPTSLRDVAVAHPGFAGPHWSLDGTALLFSDVPAGPGAAPATVIAASNGAALGTYAYGGQITDWQPCPAGGCVAWGMHHPRTVSLASSKSKVAKGKRVTLRGQVTAAGPAVATCASGQSVELQRAKARKSAPFKHLADVTSDATGKYKAEGQGHQHVPLPGRPPRPSRLRRRHVGRREGEGEEEAPPAEGQRLAVFWYFRIERGANTATRPTTQSST